MKKIDLFEIIHKFRIASYPIQDLHLMKDDWIVAMEEEWLSRFGYDYEEYQGWKSYGEEVSNPEEKIKVGGAK